MAGDDLDEICDDDRNAGDEDSGDYDEDEVEDKSSSDDDQPQPQSQPGNRPPRKMLTYNRLVNSIDKSLDRNCFDPHDFSTADHEEHETVLTGYLGPKENPATEIILWSNKNPERVDRQRNCDILPCSPQRSTLLPPASGIESIRDAFHVLFTDEMTELVINNTNDKIRHIQENLRPHFVESNKNTYVRLLDQEEFYVFIGLLYARGLLGQSMHTYKILFPETAGHQIFTATMSKHRFTFLNTVLTFDNPEERREL